MLEEYICAKFNSGINSGFSYSLYELKLQALKPRLDTRNFNIFAFTLNSFDKNKNRHKVGFYLKDV